MILDEILRKKREKLLVTKSDPAFSAVFSELRERVRPLPAPRDFAYAVGEKGGREAVRIIAEVKKASPSKGVIREDFDPLEIAKIYEGNGASAVSVLTEEDFFLGSLEYLTLVRNNVALPVLRKDFITDEFELFESRAAGADAVLLIARVLPAERLKELLSTAESLRMAALVEVHDERDLEAALGVGARIIGINNRDLETFKTDINTTVRLAAKIPEDKIVVSESGINTPGDIIALKKAGADAFLIGESLMREKDPGKKLRELLSAGGNFL